MYMLCSGLYLGGFCLWKSSGMGGRIVLWVGALRGNFMSEEFDHLFEVLIV